ncbi:hypothetical protein NP233_g5263 [Leucocoprinus birnbaumii]|uniref:L-dopachrome isomerase n=1 Tax=Leucocoprinus birnbaumii TaxID=56174 RepID=A0AAD5VVI4_9AGAR|nr:hypothetical protein NP233_g5263 [Leucocoprinus birnbaumii]
MVEIGLLAHLGAHGEAPLGLNYHTEMWFTKQGGLSNYDVIRAATASGAQTLGVFPSLGSLSSGKLADYLVYPPEVDLLGGDISLTKELAYVARGGRLWDASSMEEVWPVKGRKQEMPPFNADGQSLAMLFSTAKDVSRIKALIPVLTKGAFKMETSSLLTERVNMPSLSLTTNVRVSDPKQFSLEFSKLGAQVLGKPEDYITVQYHYNDTITFAGNHDPAFVLTIVSLENLTHEQNERYSKELSEWLKGKLGLSNDRGYIVFHDPGNSHIGYQGTTFGTIFGRRS